jgi:hypothetical protein
MPLPVPTFTRLPDAHEVTMATPSVLCVEVFEPSIDHGSLVAMGGLTGNNYRTWISATNPDRGNITDLGWVMGPDKDHIRFQDLANTVYFDREVVLDHTGYSTIGGKNVTKVKLKNFALEEGQSAGTQSAGGTNTYFCMSQRWYIYIFLDDDLPAGTWTIEWPTGAGINDTSFTFDDKVTRAHFLHSSYIGHRKNDVFKLAVFGGILPGWTSDGRVHIDDIGVTQFDIIDAAGGTVYGPFDITEFTTPDDGIMHQYISTEYEPLQIVSISTATPAVMTYSGSHDLANDEVIAFRGFEVGRALTSSPYYDFYMVRNVNTGANTCELYYETSIAYRNFTSGSAVVAVTSSTGFAPGDLFSFLYPDGLGGYTRFITTIASVDSSTQITLTDVSPATLTACRSARYLPQTLTGAYVTGTIADYPDQILKTFYAGNHGTYLFDCNYSDFAIPNEGTLYVRIIGLGVSYPIIVSEAAWNDFAALSAQGEYHQRSGMALDGRFGWTRPNTHRNGVDGTIYASTFPISYMTTQQLVFENVEHGGLMNNVNGTGANLTSNVVDWWGEWQDAGDFDVFTWGHAICSAYLLTSAIIRSDLGLTANLTSYNIPQSYDVIGTDYPDDLPDQVNQGLWGVQALLRCQAIDGAVPSGIEGVSPVGSYTGNGEGVIYGPSWINGSQWFAGAPDILSNFAAAGNGALAAIALELYGHTTKAEEYYQFAKLAYEWAKDRWDSSAVEEADYKDMITQQIVFTADFTSGQYTLTNCSTTTDVIAGMEITDVYNFTGDTTSGSPIVTNIEEGTTGITVGSNIRAALSNDDDNPLAASVLSTVVSVDSSSQITLSHNAATTATNARFRSRHTTPLPYAGSDGSNAVWNYPAGGNGHRYPYSAAMVESVDSSTQITFENLQPFGSTRPAVGSATGITLIARYPGAGWSNQMYTQNTSIIRTTALPARTFAVGALYRAATELGHTTDADTYRSLMDTIYNGSNFQGLDLFGNIQYAAASGATSDVVTSIRGNILSGITNTILIDNLTTGPLSPYRGCRSIGNIASGGGYGPMSNQGLARWLVAYDYLLRMAGQTPDEKYVSLLQASLATDHGANPSKMSTLIGCGPLHWPNCLHENSHLLGDTVPNGISVYGPSGFRYGFIVVTACIHRQSGQELSTMHDHADVDATAQANYSERRTIEPPPRARSGWEAGILSRWSISEAEFTVQQSVMVKQFLAEYLHCWDGNTQNTQGIKRVRRQVTVTT